MTKATIQTVNGYTHSANANAYLDQCPTPVKEALLQSGSAFANVVPYILLDDNKRQFESANQNAEIVELDNGGIAIDNNGTRFKIVTSKTDKFNVAPSFTKGYGRDSFGVSAKAYLSRYFDYVILVNVADKGELLATRVKVRDIEDNTIRVAR